MLYPISNPALTFLVLFLLFSPSHSQAQLIQKQGKNWKLNFNIANTISDNVKQDPGGAQSLFTDSSDTSFSWSGSVEYLHTFNDQWSLKGEYQIDMTVYSNFGAYDMTSNSWALRPRYKIDGNSFLEFQYFYLWSIAGGNSFSGVNYLAPSYSRLLGKWGLINVQVFYARTDNFRNQARDANEFGGGFNYAYIFQGTRNYLGAGYQAADEATSGRFDRTTHDIKVNGRYILPYEFHFKGQYKFSFRDYETFAATGGGVREDKQHNFNFSLTKLIKERWGILRGVTASFAWNRTTNDSNTLFRDFESNQVTFSLAAGF